MSDSQSSPPKYLDIITAFFVTVVIVSNIASSAKIVDLGFSVFGIRMAFDGGTLLFPIVYILGDVLTEVYGFKAARRVIWTGFAALALTVLVLFVLRILPPEAIWEASVGNTAYNSVLGGMSTGGIALASLLAYFTGEFVNSVLLSRIKVLMKGKHLWIRAIGSSIAGELLDTFIFILAATITGVFPRNLFLSLVLTNYLLKLSIEVLVLPITYKTVRYLKKRENIDHYDIGITYRPIG